MKTIRAASAAEEPGLAVVEVVACDDHTAFAVQEVLAARWDGHRNPPGSGRLPSRPGSPNSPPPRAPTAKLPMPRGRRAARA
ncbi:MULTISPECIES: DUF6207 family protein [unclassified Streptomyces]|uniref:DUF6207 family protein n=1 Tax=unclassified Streptomyces TaxID=2593676 RepID=UPI00210CD104|nr:MULTISPECIES: DUF6207 family protein [unclassified Streptomyces]